jgi:hypothetical protein
MFARSYYRAHHVFTRVWLDEKNVMKRHRDRNVWLPIFTRAAIFLRPDGTPSLTRYDEIKGRKNPSRIFSPHRYSVAT